MQSGNPLVSVVIPCYNHEQFVQDCIQSVIDQDYKNIELIIIDDGSKDSSVVKIEEMFESCRERFVRFEFRSRANMGLSATLNEALEWCEGEYFSAIASDDVMLPKKTSRQVNYLENHNGFVAVFGAVQLIDENDKKLEKLVSKARSYSFEDIIMHKHDLLAPTQMIRKEAIKEVGGYDSNLFIEDWYIWLKLSQIGKIFYISEFFTLYRRHNNNMSKNMIQMHQGRFDVLDCFKDHASYKKAIKNVKWMNATERFISSDDDKMKNLSRVILMNPMKFTYMLTRKIFNQTKSKITKNKFRA